MSWSPGCFQSIGSPSSSTVIPVISTWPLSFVLFTLLVSAWSDLLCSSSHFDCQHIWVHWEDQNRPGKIDPTFSWREGLLTRFSHCLTDKIWQNLPCAFWIFSSKNWKKWWFHLHWNVWMVHLMVGHLVNHIETPLEQKRTICWRIWWKFTWCLTRLQPRLLTLNSMWSQGGCSVQFDPPLDCCEEDHRLQRFSAAVDQCRLRQRAIQTTPLACFRQGAGN